MSVPFSSREPADASSEFAGLIAACLSRFLAQNEKRALSEVERAGLTDRFWRVVSREAAGPSAAEPEWREVPAGRIEGLAAKILDDSINAESRADLAVPVGQLLKACLQPEPLRCRESYSESIGGVCRRQDLARARGRISGAHCVDCPHWVSLDAAKNRALMERAWVEGPTAWFHAHHDVFLPEDFRRLRRWARDVTNRS